MRPNDVLVEFYTADTRRRLMSGRPIIRITILARAGAEVDTTAVSASVVASFHDGTLRERIPDFLVVHALLEPPGPPFIWVSPSHPRSPSLLSLSLSLPPSLSLEELPMQKLMHACS